MVRAINRTPPLPLREALRDPLLPGRFQHLITDSDELLGIVVVDPANEILAPSDDNRIGQYSPKYLDFDTLVNHSSLVEKLRLLSGREERRYQMEKPLGRGDVPLVYVRVIVLPSLILSHVIWPEMRHSAVVAIPLFGGALALIFLVLVIAFRRPG